MSSAAAAANRAFGIDRGLPFPFDDIAAGRRASCSSAATRPTRCRRRCATSTTGRERGARHVVVDPRRTATAELARTAPAAAARHRPGAGQRPAAHRDPGGPGRRGRTSPRAPPASTRCAGPSRAYWPDRVERHHRRRRSPTCATLVRSLAAAPAAMILTARGAEQHADGTDTAQAWINLALALGPARPRPGSGWGTITGQGNGQGGREHGQKADQLPGYRKLDDPAAPRARRRGVGRRPRRAARARACPPTSCSTALGTDGGVRTLLVLRVEPGRLARPTPATSSERLRALDFLAVSDIFLSETARARRRRAAHHPVGRGGRHDDQPRGPGAAAPHAPSTRRPGVRTDLQIWRGLADRLGRGRVLPDRAGGGLRGAAPGQRRRDRRLRRHHLRAPRRRGGRVLAVPGRGPPRHAAAVRRPLRHPGRPGALPAGRAPRRPPSCPTRTTRTC